VGFKGFTLPLLLRQCPPHGTDGETEAYPGSMSSNLFLLVSETPQGRVPLPQEV
jgi:hypothetical protein